MPRCQDCFEKKCKCTEEVKTRHNCSKCNTKMEDHKISMPPIQIGEHYEHKDVQLRVRVCPDCYNWFPCNECGETYASRSIINT